jgi:hypothetical protein
MSNVEYRRACETHFLGPTDHRPSRVVATHLATRKRIVVSWDHALGILENHAAAAAKVLGTDDLLACSLDGAGFVFMARDVVST